MITTITIICLVYIATYAFVYYEVKHAIEDPEDFTETKKRVSPPPTDEADENFWFNTASAI